jgi:hypothetical protein
MLTSLSLKLAAILQLFSKAHLTSMLTSLSLGLAVTHQLFSKPHLTSMLTSLSLGLAVTHQLFSKAHLTSMLTSLSFKAGRHPPIIWQAPPDIHVDQPQLRAGLHSKSLSPLTCRIQTASKHLNLN